MFKKTSLIVTRVFGIIFIIVGFLFAIGGGVTVFEKPKMISSSGISYKYMENFEYYNFEELTVLYAYSSAYYYGSVPDDWYYLVAFDDVDGNMYFASMIINENQDAFNELRQYTENKDAYLGDCVINAVVDSVYPIEEMAVSEEDVERYREAVANYKDGDVIDSGIQFDYSCKPENFEKYADEQLDEDRYMFIGGLIGCAIGIVLIIIGFRKSLKEVSSQNTNAFKQYGQGTDYSAGTYYIPPIYDDNFN